MTEPSTDEREALRERVRVLRDAFDVAFLGARAAATAGLLAAHPVQRDCCCSFCRASAKPAPSCAKTGSSVTTAEELDALPVGTRIADARGWEWEVERDVAGTFVQLIQKAGPRTLVVLEDQFPLTLLYRPEVTT